MVEKMTAVWLIILTILVCAAVPGVLIWLTTTPHVKMLLGFHLADSLPTYLSLQSIEFTSKSLAISM